MSAPPAHLGAEPELWEDDLWDELLQYVEQGSVIPIVGPDLLQLEVDGRQILLDRYVAAQLAAKFSLPMDRFPEEPSLNQVICELLAGRRRESIYASIAGIMQKATFATPAPLRQLAEIRSFQLFVTTTFDSLLEQALNEVRFSGRPQTTSIAYAPNNFKDVTEEYPPSRPVVYHLLGKLSASPSYVSCDEDLLEFVCALQSESRRPERLFDALKENHLLILGEGFPDWLTRFFLRTTRQHRLNGDRHVLEILADSRSPNDSSLVLFLQHFSSRTRVFQEGGAVEFVDALWRRCQAANLLVAVDSDKPRSLPPPPLMPAGAVFISYARQDLAAVERLKAGLEQAGLTVWFDYDQLEGGDDYNKKIKNNIRNCSHFLPVLSANTESRHDGYFRREWRYADDRALEIDPNTPFIIPVVVDETKQFFRVPELFLERQLTWLENGKVSPEFAARMQKICET